MRINTIVCRYIFKEMISPFLISLAFLMFVFLMIGILDITNLIVNYGASLGSILLLLIYSMPFFLEFIIPMSVMMAVLLSFLRLSSDNEIVALTAGGRSVYGLLPPVLILCLVGCVLTGLTAIYGLPKGRLAFSDLSRKVALSSFDAGLKEKTFNDSFDGIVLYVNHIDLKTKTFRDVFIEDHRTPDISSTVIAPRGRLFKNRDRLSFQLRLSGGSIHQVDTDRKTAQSIHFDTYDINLDLQRTVATSDKGPKDEEEMSLAELNAYLREHASRRDAQFYLTLMEYHKKFALPAACFALGLLAVPLGIRSRSSRKSFGVGLGLVFFLLYYLLLSAGWVFGESGRYPPIVGMWVPNIVMGGIGLFLIVRVANEGRFKIGWPKRVTRIRLKGKD